MGYVDALVIGNGPSRELLPDRGEALVRNFQGLVIGCNAQWVEPFSDAIHWYVAYDPCQILDLATKTDRPVFVPLHRFTMGKRYSPVELRPPDQSRFRERYRIIEPNTSDFPADWSGPSETAVGNFSGMLAYQLAWLAGCSAIWLLGMDCSVVPKGDPGKNQQFRRTCMDPAMEGYGEDNVFGAKLVRVENITEREVWMPHAWNAARTTWQRLTRVAREQGVRTYRTHDTGSLDWLPVRARMMVRGLRYRPADPEAYADA